MTELKNSGRRSILFFSYSAKVVVVAHKKMLSLGPDKNEGVAKSTLFCTQKFSSGIFWSCVLLQSWTIVIQTWPEEHKRAFLKRFHNEVFVHLLLGDKWAWQSRQPCEIVWAESHQSADLYKKMPPWADLIFTVEMLLLLRLAIA